MKKTILTLFLAALLIVGCSTGASTDQVCYEATRANAEATEKFLILKDTDKVAADAWLYAQLAAKRWQDAVCPKPHT